MLDLIIAALATVAAELYLQRLHARESIKPWVMTPWSMYFRKHAKNSLRMSQHSDTIVYR